MNSAILSMLGRYECRTTRDYENALKEIIQEVALLGLWRSKFFEHAAFYGETALRILYGLDRFSEDLDFSLLKPNHQFKLEPYLKAIRTELNAMGFTVTIEEKDKRMDTAITSAFIKAGTKEHLLKINAPREISQRVQENVLIHVKVEVDTDPPGGFETEVRRLLQPIPFQVNTFQKPDLFAGKIHAILQRKWQNRVKGRDFYDFVWYVAQNVPVRMSHLEGRLRQSGGWKGARKLNLQDLQGLLKDKFAEINFEAAKRDVMPFLKDKAAIELWSQNFFDSLLEQLKEARLG